MKKTILQMGMIVLLAVLLGLARNFLFKNPLPLFRYQPPALGEPEVVYRASFQDADADFTRQMGASGSALLLDSRLPDLFGQGHLPAALSLPLADFERSYARLAPRLQAGAMIIVYDQGRPCRDAQLLLEKLWDKGCRNLFLFCGGVGEWLENGNEMER